MLHCVAMAIKRESFYGRLIRDAKISYTLLVGQEIRNEDVMNTIPPPPPSVGLATCNPLRFRGRRSAKGSASNGSRDRWRKSW